MKIRKLAYLEEADTAYLKWVAKHTGKTESHLLRQAWYAYAGTKRLTYFDKGDGE